jgi:hypothetical protein
MSLQANHPSQETGLTENVERGKCRNKKYRKGKYRKEKVIRVKK